MAHLIISHHGEYEYGSPKLPMTLEALILHKLDDLDSKIQAMQWALERDGSIEGEWTSFNAMFQRPLYRGPRDVQSGQTTGPQAAEQTESLSQGNSGREEAKAKT